VFFLDDLDHACTLISVNNYLD